MPVRFFQHWLENRDKRKKKTANQQSRLKAFGTRAVNLIFYCICQNNAGIEDDLESGQSIAKDLDDGISEDIKFVRNLFRRECSPGLTSDVRFVRNLFRRCEHTPGYDTELAHRLKNLFNADCSERSPGYDTEMLSYLKNLFYCESTPGYDLDVLSHLKDLFYNCESSPGYDTEILSYLKNILHCDKSPGYDPELFTHLELLFQPESTDRAAVAAPNTQDDSKVMAHQQLADGQLIPKEEQDERPADYSTLGENYVGENCISSSVLHDRGYWRFLEGCSMEQHCAPSLVFFGLCMEDAYEDVFEDILTRCEEDGSPSESTDQHIDHSSQGHVT